MDRSIRLLRWLAALVVAAGMASLWLLRRPAGLAEGWRLVREEVAVGLSRPLALTAAGVALGALLLARLLEGFRWPRLARRPRGEAHRGLSRSKAERAPVADSELSRLGRRLARRVGSGRRMVRFVDELLAGAIRAGASDIHVHPGDAETGVSLRIGGRLTELLAVPASLHPELIRRLKILGDLVAYESREPQDGRFTFASEIGEVDVRLSVVPSHHGERAALRLAPRGAGLGRHGGRGLTELGMPTELLAAYTELLARPQGLLVLNGPTGCGKTTTIYASLEQIHRERGGRTHIATLEDPVEADLPFLQQTEARASSGLGFAEGLRALLRQDPNVLMVGEIRDGETAATAVQAGLSGHLILTTLHAESAAGAFARLIDMGVEPFRVASATLACLSQRLLRALCPECRQPVLPGEREAPALGRLGVLDLGHRFYGPRGCKACEGTGYRGRMALFELLAVSPALRQAITERRPTPELEALAAGEGLVTLREQALAAAREGTISLRDLVEAV